MDASTSRRPAEHSLQQQDHFSIERLHPALKKRSFQSGVMTSGAQAILVFLSVVQTVVLARMLRRCDDGLVAMITVVTGLATMFKVGGLQTRTIQRPEIPHSQIPPLFWMNVAMGIGLAAIVASSEHLSAWIWNEPRLAGLLAGTFLTCMIVVCAAGIQRQALIRRQTPIGVLTCNQISTLISEESSNCTARAFFELVFSVPQAITWTFMRQKP
ncbi:oligosaccharide flippase family protein [Planctomicrobium sp. SH661]|uniref:oligosaccharide flippase family protein n=1 Tax=Planctomicrobium sp. SH661 TaxID=3448124 RepID=UPI003F5C7A0B